jgi:hypothetical protein
MYQLWGLFSKKKSRRSWNTGNYVKEANVLYFRSPFQVLILGHCINSHTTHQQVKNEWRIQYPWEGGVVVHFNTLRTGDADLRFYITTVQDGWCKSAFITSAYFPCTIHLIMQYIEHVSEWFCWRMFTETWPHSELTFRHRASSI